ncbi:VCBS repeat-containing protein [Sinomicrobium sp. FJxs]|uniref:VCBS repeat-containing protein n=1 Tax=Sinomicrobium weinanense TaxID=2842200 RepID=A0A926JNN4_9FLAO|nr:VCBS repeat-containing protein [Sinomicrobium weinanense]MBU3124364.1 VCBS repeat-containing protein [Sinomicrobium weinanense]
MFINQGNLTFKDITDAAGIKTPSWCTGVSIVDINNDGLSDIYVSTAHDQNFRQSRNYFFLNTISDDGTVSFREMASEMGIADLSYTVQAAWLDYDKDGDLDLFLINNAMEEYPKNNPLGQRKDGSGRSTDKLYRNDGADEKGIPAFTDVSEQAGIQVEGWSLGVAVTDINNDNYPDIYIANDFYSNDILYINNGDGTFSNRINHYFKHQSHNSMGVNIADVNNDAVQDVLVLDMLPEDNIRHKTMFGQIPFSRVQQAKAQGYAPQYVRNVLQMSNAGVYSDLGFYAGVAATDWSWCPLIADFDNDGHKDIYITNGYKKDITDLDFVDFTNKASTFGTVEDKRKLLVEQLNKMKGVKKSNFFFENTGKGVFADHTNEAGLYLPSYSNGAIDVDLDLDGDLDLVANNIEDDVLLFENRSNRSEHIRKNFLQVKLQANAQSLGAKIWLYTKGEVQFAEFYPHKGYMSSLPPVLHFGLDSIQEIDSLKILWPGNQRETRKNVKVNQTLSPQPGNFSVKPVNTIPEKSTKTCFEVMNSSATISYKSKENAFDDFRKWPLHFRSYSKAGPVLTVGDVNGDGLEDLFAGGSSNNYGTFYIRQKDGSFTEQVLKDPIGLPMEDTAALLFDADNDNDPDLYVVSGSSEHYKTPELYQDRLYINDGKGHFSLQPDALPKIRAAGGCVVAFDYDADGDLDLFVGGRIKADEYPRSPRSYLLENNEGIFTDVTAQKAPRLLKPGMVTAAYTTDLDKNGRTDLILVGEWMPVQIYYNNDKGLKMDESPNGLENTNGWWNCMAGEDFDKDGDIDFIAGNWGLNTPFKASVDEPLSIYAKDYDQNGSMEPIMTYYNQGKEHIIHPRGTLTGRLPALRHLVKSYREYGKMQIDEVFEASVLEDATRVHAYELGSVYIENLGNGKFRYTRLPEEVQWSPVFDFTITDIDLDGYRDVLAVGNYHDTEVLTGRFDAGNGSCLVFRDNGFQPVKPSVSGFFVPGEGRSIVRLNTKDKGETVIVGIQQDSLKIFRKRELSKKQNGLK